VKSNKSEQCSNGMKTKWENLSNSRWSACSDHDHPTDSPPVFLFMHKLIHSNKDIHQWGNRSSTLQPVLMWLHGSTASWGYGL